MTLDWASDTVILVRGLLVREAAECAQLAIAAAAAQRTDVVEALRCRREGCVKLAGALAAPGHQHAHWYNPEARPVER